MRTTLTIDDDIVAKLNREMRRSGKSFKATVNEFLRLGLNMRKDLRAAEPFKLQPRKLGVRPELDYDNIEELLDQIEGPVRR
jgi:hypothetical protein